MDSQSNRHSSNDPKRGKIPPFSPEWIKYKIDDDTILYAEDLGKKLVDGKFTTSQFRNFYGELKRIEMGKIENNQTAFLLLKPKLAYGTARAKKQSKGHGPDLFKNEIFKAYDEVKISQDGYPARFKNFCQIVEAILAFHKAEGGRD